MLPSRLGDYYANGTGKVSDFTLEASEDLIEIFATMENYYAFGVGKDFSQASELWQIYDTLAEVFGKASDFNMDEQKLNSIYNSIREGEDI